jgi:hypothetical protein
MSKMIRRFPQPPQFNCSCWVLMKEAEAIPCCACSTGFASFSLPLTQTTLSARKSKLQRNCPAFCRE